MIMRIRQCFIIICSTLFLSMETVQYDLFQDRIRLHFDVNVLTFIITSYTDFPLFVGIILCILSVNNLKLKTIEQTLVLYY